LETNERDGGLYDLAASMADKSPLEFELAKKAINAGLRMGLGEGLKHESELFAQMFTTANKEEGIGAFLGVTSPNLLVSNPSITRNEVEYQTSSLARVSRSLPPLRRSIPANCPPDDRFER
jgi:hypothetical protein